LNPDGSKTDTKASYSANGTLLSKQIVTTSGNGLSITTQTDANGDGAIDAKTTDVTVINANGSRTETTSNFNGAGTVLLNRTIVTAAANGLSKTIAKDLDGNGTADLTDTDVTTLNTDGSTVETVSARAANGALLSKTVVTTSADKKTLATSRDLDGDGVIDQSVVSAVNGDGSTSTTTSTFSGTGGLTSKSTTTVSGDGLTTTIVTDLDADWNVDQLSKAATVVNADGSKTVTASNYTGTSTLKDRTVTTTSASGLSVTTKMDANGDGTFERTTTSVKTLNADGSVTTVVSDTNANGSLHARTMTTVSADQNVIVTVSDIDGDGIADQTVAKSVNTDGSVSTVYSDGAGANSTNGAGTNAGLWNDRGWIHSGSDNKRVTVSGNGLSTTTDYDADGDGFIDTQSREVAVINADGSTTRTISDYAAVPTNPSMSGPNSAYFGNASYTTYQQALARYPTQALPQYTYTLKDKAAITTSADGLTVTRQWDLTGSGNLIESQTDQTVRNADGSKTETVSLSVGSTLKSRIATTVSGNGLSTTTLWDPTGSGSYGQILTDTTTINADGSTTRDVIGTRDGVQIARTVTKVAADGRSSTSWIDTDGVGGVDHTQTTTTLTRADGSTVVTIADNTLVAGGTSGKIVTTTSADSRLVTITRDANGDGIVDQKEVITKAVDGSSTDVVTNLAPDGSVKDRTSVAKSWDRLTTKTDWDLNGDGLIDHSRTDTRAANADGSSTDTIQDFQVSQRGAGGAFAAISPVLKKTTTISVSADGRTQTTTIDVDSNGSIDQTSTAVTAIDGSLVTTTTTDDAARKIGTLPGTVAWASQLGTYDKTIAAKTVATISADGLSWSVQADYDGNGSFEHSETWHKLIDGSQTGTIQDVDASGVVVAKGTETISADGLTTTLKEDSNNDGVTDHIEVSVKGLDGSLKKTVTDLNPDGSTKSSSVTTVDPTGTHVHIANGDGSYTETYGNGGVGLDGNSPNPGLESSQRSYDAQGRITFARDVYADGYSWEQTRDVANTQSWNRIESSFDPQGRLQQQRTRNDDGSYVDIYPMGTHFLGWGNPANVWSQINTDAQGRQTWGRDNFADGSHWEGVWDTANAQTWSNYQSWFNAQGQMTRQETNYDDGTRVEVFPTGTADPAWGGTAGATWSQRNYDAQGRITWGQDNFSDGTHTEMAWDTANANGWSFIKHSFNAQGTDIHQQQWNDDGTSLEVYPTGTYSITHTGNPKAVWSQVNYTKDGAFSWARDNFSNGTHWESWWDTDNSQNYSQVQQYFGASGTIYRQIITYDNGSVYDSATVRMGMRSPTTGVSYSEPTHGGMNGGSGGPVVLDLAGLGASAMLTTLSASGASFDMAGDGRLRHTAWAAPGEGVLALDADGDGQITQQREITFTAWAPGTTSDMQALSGVFDTNHNGTLDPGDTRWREFRVLVDGRTKTLDELGIASIGLTPHGKTVTYADGSSVNGTSLFTRTDGSQALAGDVTLAYDNTPLTNPPPSQAITGPQTFTTTPGGNQTFVGGPARDIFVFTPHFGQNTIAGYQAAGPSADQINIDHSVFADWATLLSHTRQSDTDTIITADANDVITLKNTTVASLQQSNFHFT
ncbi:hypothetical protein ACETRX_35540, partial [Labrys portucalensis]